MEIEYLLRIILSVLLGGITGIELELSGARGGLRACMLTALSTGVMMLIFFKGDLPTAEQAVFPALLLIAISLPVSGSIIKPERMLQAPFAAFSIIGAGAVGAIAACGLYVPAFFAAILSFGAGRFAVYASQFITTKERIHSYIIGTDDSASVIIQIKKITIDLGIKTVNSAIKRTKDGFDIELVINTSEQKNREFLQSALQLQGVKEITGEKL